MFCVNKLDCRFDQFDAIFYLFVSGPMSQFTRMLYVTHYVTQSQQVTQLWQRDRAMHAEICRVGDFKGVGRLQAKF